MTLTVLLTLCQADFLHMYLFFFWELCLVSHCLSLALFSVQESKVSSPSSESRYGLDPQLLPSAVSYSLGYSYIAHTEMAVHTVHRFENIHLYFYCLETCRIVFQLSFLIFMWDTGSHFSLVGKMHYATEMNNQAIYIFSRV